MNWNRVPAVKAWNNFLDSFRYGLYQVFIKFPLYVAGYKWCVMCEGKISPKETIVTKTIHSLYGELSYHCCDKCAENNEM